MKNQKQSLDLTALASPALGVNLLQSWCIASDCPGACTIKLFMAVIYWFLYKARVFVIGKPFQPSLMFARSLS
jgi:hypothetical protein